MPISVITVGAQTVNVVTLPTVPGMRSVEFKWHNSVAVSPRSFTGQMQRQAWPGADMWSGTFTLPPLTQAQADVWEAALLQCRGVQNAFQLGDPRKKIPRGTPTGSPAVDNSQNGGNQAMSQALGTKGWTPATSGLLLAGDYIMAGFRMYRVLDDVASDGLGKALIPIAPSLREQPTDNWSIATSNCVALLCLAENDLSSSGDYTRLSKLSFQFMEYR
jgi:hypothetical protein